jgi:hypothetical protein
VAEEATSKLAGSLQQRKGHHHQVVAASQKNALFYNPHDAHSSTGDESITCISFIHQRREQQPGG